MSIGGRIEALRKIRNWSQRDLAAAMEESQSSVSQWEAGKVLPELDQLIHLSMIFEVSLSELMGDQAGAYDLQQETDPKREAEKRKKDRILLGFKLLGVLIFILICVLVNMIWFRFLFRFTG